MTDTNYRSNFLELFRRLQDHPLFQTMEQTVENSPWHREANVRIHTTMVVGEYLVRTDKRVGTDNWQLPEYLGALACAFHDVGKPAARTAKYSEARGDYFAYPGHDLISARLFEDYAVGNLPDLSSYDIWAVSWLIEHHMPWDMKDNTKREWLAKTAANIGTDVYTTILISDTVGRWSDDSAEKVAKSQAWIDEFVQLNVHERVVLPNVPTLWVPIGASGTGKTTLLSTIRRQRPHVQVFSLDALRHEFYDPDDYAKAFAASCADKEFSSRAQAVFKQMVDEGVSIYVDNTNTSVKGRRFWIDYARQHGYFCIGLVLPVQIDTIVDRQRTRTDKSVPADAVRRQYMSLQAPSYGEFDLIG